MFFKKASSQIEWIVAGLGNPGKKYEGTRHNIGFDALDYAADKWGIDVKRSKFDALYGTGEVEGKKILLLKPQTFMNLSGVSVQKASDFYKVPAKRVLVLFDDISLQPGMLRIRLSGSAGGHNGLKSIITFVGDQFPRVKIGVGAKPHPDYDLADWVLSRFTTAERKAIDARLNDITLAAQLLMQGKISEAMSQYNGEGHTL
ncbi:MAG: aminoacyl-tRNA hydrolase [Oscillospiraceae bacterium]